MHANRLSVDCIGIARTFTSHATYVSFSFLAWKNIKQENVDRYEYRTDSNLMKYIRTIINDMLDEN